MTELFSKPAAGGIIEHKGYKVINYTRRLHELNIPAYLAMRAGK